MKRLIVIVAWLLLIVAGPLVQAAQTVTDGTSHHSFATPVKTSRIAFSQPADCFFAAEWVLPNDDNSSGNDQSNACGFSTQSYFDFGNWLLFSEKTGLSFDQFAGPGQFTPLFILFHTWKILPRQ
jgi:hypothetical protein